LLFVDDEPQLLRRLQLASRAMSEQREMASVGSGQEAPAARITSVPGLPEVFVQMLDALEAA
jgi:hypothetical protein